jgi:RND family efflux transporter MFP subunit
MVLIAAGLLWVACGQHEQAAGGVYYCPMHPTYTSDRPGECPICGMTLVRRQDAEPVEHAGHVAGAPQSQPAGAPSQPAAAVEGRITVTLSPERQQLIGVTTALVQRLPLERRLRTVGRVAYDERLINHVHTKFEGFIEHLYVDYTGALVNKGDKLLEIYSPELLATQQEFLLALRAYEQMKDSSVSDVAERARALLESARQRLLLWDIAASDVERLEREGQPRKTLALYSTHSGYVVQKTAFHGMRVMPGDSLYDIADLSHIWILADVYEYELANVRIGQTATMTLSHLPGRSWQGRVTYVYPEVEAATRTVKVRLEFPNPQLTLKPEMFADVEIQADLGAALVVPDSAVITTGTRNLVFVDLGGGRFEPRVVEIGTRLPNAFEVRSGLKQGERVVTAANFLLDSESKLKAAISGMSAGAHTGHGSGS